MKRLRPALLACALAATSVAAAEPPSFNEHIRPILADNCLACHGLDAGKRKAKLRLDTPEGAYAEHNGNRAVVPGDLERSELWHRITTQDPDDVMPPPESHKTALTAPQRELIRQWILGGARYEPHWAFAPIARPTLPAPQAGAGDHPVDRFVGDKLAARGLRLAREATPEVLLRRLSLDLTGLPPTPEEVDAFLADRQPGAYERQVERLLASPRHGEHLGRVWLDAVRYADTHGLHLDNVRMIWPYRDWVVKAFNRNLPFDQFTIEQLAGDLLPNPRNDQLVASGYNRNHLTTSEGGAIEAEAEMRNTSDRVETTTAVWLGLTANCAACHDHKFDPISQREFYTFGAIFKGLADRVWDGNVRLPGPIALIAPDEATQRRVDAANTAAAPVEAALTARVEAALREHPAKKHAKQPITYEVIWAEDSDLPLAADVGRPPRSGEWREGPGVPVAGGRRALRLEGKTDRAFPFTAGDITLAVKTEATAFVHFQPDPAQPPRAVSLEFESGEKTRRFVWGDPTAFGPEVAAKAIFAGPLPPAGSYARLELPACDGGVAAGKAYTGLRVAQSDGAGWWDRAGAVISSPSAADDPLLSADAWASGLRASARFVEGVPLRHDIKYLIGLSPTQQNEEEKQRLARFHREHLYGPLRATVEPEAHAARRVLAEQIHWELTLPGTLISRELPKPLPAHVLIRGQYDRPGEAVTAATPAFLPPLKPTGDRVSRLDLARWLTAPEQPLTARVTVNRFWQHFFGAGLVRTPGDFGTQGEPPSHPALLDWLATRFREGGWDVRALIRLLVTSQAYRQDAHATPELLELDPANVLLARGPRFRLDAEVLRDQALLVSGRMVERVGGPPVRPYQPANIWEPVAFGGSNTKDYVQDHGEALYRRSLYTFWKRTAPAPAMSTFDAPSRESVCVGRNRSNTPLQALALMNDVQHVEAARGFAERLLRRGGADAALLAYGFRSVTARTPDEQEAGILAAALSQHRRHYAAHPEEAAKLRGHGESRPDQTLAAPEVAAWTMVANLLLNLDETLNRN